jgi:hypothetical protein
MKRTTRRFPAILASIAILSGIVLSGCAPDTGKGFEIYLTANDPPPAILASISCIIIADEPVIGGKDIVAYDAETHEITLTAAAFEKIAALPVPVGGKTFAACVNKEIIYVGAFWTVISSQSFEGVTIMKPLDDTGDTVRIQLGYPGGFSGSHDPRGDSRIIAALDSAGKLAAG